jgi:hypothetical protein
MNFEIVTFIDFTIALTDEIETHFTDIAKTFLFYL